MAKTAAAASPLQCVWIVRGSESSVGSYSYALCGRQEVGPRVVSEEECASCDLWEPSPPVLERREIVPLPRRRKPRALRTKSTRYSPS